jgi:hypothetical protein
MDGCVSLEVLEVESWCERMGGWKSDVVDCVLSLLKRLEAEGMGVMSLDEEGRWGVGALCEREVGGR